MPSHKVSMRASMSNQTTHFGIMGGLFNRKISGRSSMNRVTSRLEIPASAKKGMKFMQKHNLLSKNPQGSGGVGKMNKVSSCDCIFLNKNIKEESFQPEPIEGTVCVPGSDELCHDHLGRSICSQCCASYIGPYGCIACIEGISGCLGILPEVCDSSSNDYQIIKAKCNKGNNITSEECTKCIQKNITNTCYTMKMATDTLFDSSMNVKRLGYKFTNSLYPKESFCCEFGYNDSSGCTDKTKECVLSNNNNNNVPDISFC